MQSKTSSFNPTLFHRKIFVHDLVRFWPLWALYALVWLLAMPLSWLTRLPHLTLGVIGLDMLSYSRELLDEALIIGQVFSLMMGIPAAMAVFSYLTNPRATNGLHTFPVRRETLYVTHYCAGLFCQLLAQGIAALLGLAVFSGYGGGSISLLGQLFCAMMLPTLFYYSFGVLCMMFTGQILAAPVFYFVLNFLVVSMEFLLRTFAGNFLYGYANSGILLSCLSPFCNMALTRSVRTAPILGGPLSEMTGFFIQGVAWLWIYAAAGLVCAALGLLIYRRRHSEATGTTVAVYWARPVFKYGVAFCAAFAFGQFLYFILFSGTFSQGGAIACMAAAGLLGYFAAEMLLRKSFRVLKSGWKGAAVVAALLIFLCVILPLDPTGYQRYVPEPEDVTEANIRFYLSGANARAVWINCNSSQETVLHRLTDAQRALIADKAQQLSGNGVFTEEQRSSDTKHQFLEGDFQVTYHLRDGRVVRRNYDQVRLSALRLDNANSPESAFLALYNDPTITLYRVLNYSGQPEDLPDFRITGGFLQAEYEQVELDGAEYYRPSTEYNLSADQARVLYDAVRRDIAMGHIDDTFFGEDPMLNLYAELYATCEGESSREQLSLRPSVNSSMTETLAALRSFGLNRLVDELTVQNAS